MFPNKRGNSLRRTLKGVEHPNKERISRTTRGISERPLISMVTFSVRKYTGDNFNSNDRKIKESKAIQMQH